MKLLLILASLFSTAAMSASFEKPPAFLEDAVITVVLQNGKAHHFDANKWKVVERIKTKRVKAVKAKTCPQPKIIIEEKIVEKVVEKRFVTFKKNRISILAGYGPIGLITTVEGDIDQTFEVEKDFGPITGARYTRNFDSTISMSVEYLTNHTGTLGLGWGW